MNNLSYIESIYRQWQTDPSSVDKEWDEFFRQPSGPEAAKTRVTPQGQPDDMVYKQSRVDSMLWAYRDIGYLYARLNPLGGDY